MMKRLINTTILLLLFIFFENEKSNAQAPGWLWARSVGGINSEQIFSVATDDSGNVYSTGFFNGTVDFDPGVDTFNLTSAGDEDIFICKLSSTGDFDWARAIGAGGSDRSYAIALDALGNIYTTGFFFGTVDFDPGVTTFDLTSLGNNDAFILKLDNAGNFIWAKSMGGTTSSGGNSIAVGSSAGGSVYVAGSFDGTVDFDPDSSATFNITAHGGLDLFISKLDTSGRLAWAKTVGGNDDDQAYSIAIDASGNIYGTGYFEGTVDFDPGNGIYNLAGANSLPDVFITKLDSSGDFVWAKAISGTGDEDGYSVSIDHSNNVYVCGYFIGTADFDPGSATFNLTSAGAYDIFISKLDSAGNFKWASAMGGTDDDQGFSLALDDFGNVYSTGIFRSTADFDPGPGTFNLVSSGNWDTFISCLDSTGNFLWALNAGGTARDQANSIVVDTSGNIYIAGYFYSPTALFGTNMLSNADISGSTEDAFIAKLDHTPTATSNEIFKQDIFLYPNPTADILHIHADGQCGILKLFNSIGTDLLMQRMMPGDSWLDLSEFPDGLYLVKISPAGRNEINLKVVVQHE